MLGLYLDTLIIGQNVCNIFSVLNELTLQKELHDFETNSVFGQKCKNTATTKQKIKHKILARAGN